MASNRRDGILCHGFHETAQGVWFTISETARREVLGRLLELNHQRYAEEVAAGGHEKGGSAKTRSGAKGRDRLKPKDGGQAALFTEGQA